MSKKKIVIQCFVLSIILNVMFFLCGNCAKAEHPSDSPDWELTFCDEFNGNALDSAKWFPGYRLGRVEYYKKLGFPGPHTKGWQPVPPVAHYVLQDGILRLRVDKDLPQRDKPATKTVSALTSAIFKYDEKDKTFSDQVKFGQRLGWFEIRCRFPRGLGSYSAFWLHQIGAKNQEYTLDGKVKSLKDGPLEIDIFEMLGSEMDRQTIQFNVHFTQKGHHVHQMKFNPSKDFHTWAINWEENKITWYCDRKEIYVYNGKTPPEKMYILVAMFQIGGWVGPIDPNMKYPLDFEIDYIKVWKKKTNK